MKKRLGIWGRRKVGYIRGNWKEERGGKWNSYIRIEKRDKVGTYYSNIFWFEIFNFWYLGINNLEVLRNFEFINIFVFWKLWKLWECLRKGGLFIFISICKI